MDRDARAAEMMRIEHELAALREHYAALQRGGERMRIFVPIALVIVAGLLVALTIKDVAAGLFALSMILVFVVACRLCGRLTNDPAARTFRWIDVAVPTPYYFYMGPSTAQRVEGWIADRERRLAELKSIHS
jgi:hypothetical protein